MSNVPELRWWQREYENLLRAHLIEHGKPEPVRLDVRLATLPKPKLSDVLRCAQLAKEQPGVWEEARAQAMLPQQVWDDDERRPPELLPLFTHWYRYKHGLQDHLPDAFIIDPVLREWAHPDFDGDEVAALRRILSTIPWKSYVEDLADSCMD